MQILFDTHFDFRTVLFSPVTKEYFPSFLLCNCTWYPSRIKKSKGRSAKVRIRHSALDAEFIIESIVSSEEF